MALFSRPVQSVTRSTATAGLFALAIAAGGCLDKGFLDQTELGAFNEQPMVVPILDKLDTGIDEEARHFPNAEEPTAADLVDEGGDYTIGANDLVAITITDLSGPGQETLKQVRVTDSGKVSLPYVGQVSVAGLTEAQAEEAVSKAYRDAQIIQNAQVSVITVEARNRTFEIGGATGRAGTFQILKRDFRLIDAFILSSDFDVTRGTRGYKEVFIIRKKTEAEKAARPQTNEAPAQDSPADILRPRGQANPNGPTSPTVYLRAQPTDAPTTAETPAEQPPAAPAESGEGRYVIIDGKPVLVGGSTQPVPAEAQPPAVTEAPAVTQTPADAMAATPTEQQPFEFNAPQEPTDTRVIRVPIRKLVRGELKYNIVIRPGDVIWVPAPREGVYYMGGHVQRVGVYALGNGNDVSLMDAIIAAGGLDQVAVPWRTQIIRRVGDRQVFATVDLTKIFNGLEPDIYLKQDDKVIVGTQFWAPFLAGLRNGFRITYGFGFLYDRNYAVDEQTR